MTPEQAKAAYEAMSPENKARLAELVRKMCAAVTKLDASLVKAGQAMAEDTEKWLREETR